MMATTKEIIVDTDVAVCCSFCKYYLQQLFRLIKPAGFLSQFENGVFFQKSGRKIHGNPHFVRILLFIITEYIFSTDLFHFLSRIKIIYK
jgi:hypothetical protein